MSRFVFIIASVLLLARVAEARSSHDAFSEKLMAAGWTLNPVRGTTMQVGDIYNPESQTPLVFGSQCFSAKPREGSYEEAEVLQALKAGLSFPLGLLGAKAEGQRVIQHIFAAPYISEVAEIDLLPNLRCASFLEENTRDAFVVTAVLMAEVLEQECINIGGAIGGKVGVKARVEQECTQKSQGHVVVAYKSQSALNLFKGNSTPVQAVSTSNSLGQVCDFEQVHVERNMVILDGELYNIRSKKEEAILLEKLESCGLSQAMAGYHLWRGRRRSAILWGASLVGTIYVMPWMGVAAVRARNTFESSLNTMPKL